MGIMRIGRGLIQKGNFIFSFQVIDILEFDDQNKIVELKIIYDTVQSRALVEAMKKD